LLQLEPLLDVDRLRSTLDRDRGTFERNRPFPHLIIDDFLVPETAQRLAGRFPDLDAKAKAIARLLEGRSYASNLDRYGVEFIEAFGALGAPDFTAYLRELTSVGDLEIDPLAIGGGIHQGARGSTLHVHADTNVNSADASRYRRINVMLYLSPDWEASWGGNLDLYDRTGTKQLASIEPRFNRAVVLEIGEDSFHGYKSLRCPSSTTRKALAAHYYSDAPGPRQTVEPHDTIRIQPGGPTLLGRVAYKIRRKIFVAVMSVDGITPTPKA